MPHVTFENMLKQHQLTVQRTQVTTLQVNIGKRCNQACHHCHVEAGPNRTENMTRETVDRLLVLLAQEATIETVDITGGAPELNPHFRYFVSAIRAMGKAVIDRCNLTVLFEKGQEDTAVFLRDNHVQIIASLPCYSKENLEKQRGKGVFDKSIRALQQLNKLGYGKENSGLLLHLVYNPVGVFLPPDQQTLEREYKAILSEEFAIEFNQLLTITNMPINRFKHFLKKANQLEQYQQLLFEHFNAKAATEVMCVNLVSVSWDGYLYDCDFNQMLDLPVNRQKCSIWDIDHFSDLKGDIAFAQHCFGCTAGAGSSCRGALT